jgi:lysophospholipase L1-like esterase
VLFVLELWLQVDFAREIYRGVRRHSPHPFLQTTASDTVLCNSSGFRGDPITEAKQPGTFRIFTLGGSTTLGVANTYEESYPYILQKLLRERYPDARIEVQNAGAPWYSTAHMLVNYELRVRPYSPDLVIAFEAINDLYRSFSPPWLASGPFKADYSHFLGPQARLQGPDVDTVGASTPPLGSTWLFWRNVVRRFGRDPSPYRSWPENVQLVTARLQPRTVTTFRSLPVFRRNYERLVRNMMGDGVRVVVGSQPFLYSTSLAAEDRLRLYYPQLFCSEEGTYPTLESMIDGMRQYNAQAQQVAAGAHADFLDFEHAVPKNGEFFSDDVHMRVAGNAILARMVFEWIVAQGLVERRH